MSHSNDFDNTFITQMYIWWIDNQIRIECGPIQCHVLSGSWIHDPFAHVFGMCVVMHYKLGSHQPHSHFCTFVCVCMCFFLLNL